MNSKILADTATIDGYLKTMATEINALYKQKPFQIIGICTGGIWVAQRLQQYLNHSNPIGILDISFYRDDFSRIGLNPEVRPSQIPFSMDNEDVLVVDDVLFTGRTIRAALNVIFDYGRPNSVKLAVLVDRGQRELPIDADCIGITANIEHNQAIKLTGPDPLTLTLNDL